MNDEYLDDYPCNDCPSAYYCDSWEAQFCCTLCRYNYDGDTPCDDCDPMDIQAFLKRNQQDRGYGLQPVSHVLTKYEKVHKSRLCFKYEKR